MKNVIIAILAIACWMPASAQKKFSITRYENSSDFNRQEIESIINQEFGEFISLEETGEEQIRIFGKRFTVNLRKFKSEKEKTFYRGYVDNMQIIAAVGENFIGYYNALIVSLVKESVYPQVGESYVNIYATRDFF